MKNGIVGENTLLGGPLSQENRPHGKGSSYGKDGMKLKLNQPCACGAGTPITQRAK